MYTVSMGDDILNFVFTYAKGQTIEGCVREGMMKLFPRINFGSTLTDLVFEGGTTTDEVHELCAPLASDFNVQEVDDISNYMYTRSLSDTVCFDTLATSIGATKFRRPTGVVIPVTATGVRGKTVVLFVKPAIVRSIDMLVAAAFDDEREKREGRINTLDRMLAFVSAAYKAVAELDYIRGRLDQLSAYVSPSTIVNIGKAKYGKGFSMNDVDVVVNMHSVYPVRFSVGPDAETNAVKTLFSFIEMLGKYIDHEKMLYNEFGIDSIKRYQDDIDRIANSQIIVAGTDKGRTGK